ncbi:hypothetical protein ACV3BX_007108 [Pseudomonas aeruginosa]
METFIQVIVGVSLILFGYEGYKFLRRLRLENLINENTRKSSTNIHENAKEIIFEEIQDQELSSKLKGLMFLAKKMGEESAAKQKKFENQQKIMKLILVLFHFGLTISGAYLIYEAFYGE